jgi:rubrerythrin
MSILPEHLPQTVAEATPYIYGITTPTADDLKLMVCLEAAGQGFYGAFAEATTNEEVKAIFAKNGQEELAHAHRVNRALKMVFDVEFAVPDPADNPFYAWPNTAVITRDMLLGIAQAELAGDALYDLWATNLGHDEAARLLRQNGKEEKGHGERMLHASSLI